MSRLIFAVRHNIWPMNSLYKFIFFEISMCSPSLQSGTIGLKPVARHQHTNQSNKIKLVYKNKKIIQFRILIFVNTECGNVYVCVCVWPVFCWDKTCPRHAQMYSEFWTVVETHKMQNKCRKVLAKFNGAKAKKSAISHWIQSIYFVSDPLIIYNFVRRKISNWIFWHANW